jgi:hypothetical protein
VQLIDFIETDRNLKVATTNYDTVSDGRGKGEGEKIYFPFPFTLLDKIVYSALLFKKSSI